eukprot:scaffold30705_cov17-Tisochrysis_lutea.AAC.1
MASVSCCCRSSTQGEGIQSAGLHQQRKPPAYLLVTMNFLGVKRTTTNWAVLRGCLHQPLQCFGSELQSSCFHSLLNTDSLSAVRSGGAISMNDFSADMRNRLQGVWREAELVTVDPRVVPMGQHPRGHNNKLSTFQAWFSTPGRRSPFACNARQTYVSLKDNYLTDTGFLALARGAT